MTKGKRIHIGVACKKHGYVTDLTEGGHCSACVEENRKQKSKLNVGRYSPFTPWTYEDITDHPIHVTSKGQLRKLEKQYGVKTARLM